MMNHQDIEMDWLKRWSLYSPNRIALKDGETQTEISYENMFASVVCGARHLQHKYGIQKGDRIAVLAMNELEYVYLFFAAQRLGAILVPINFRLTPREVEHIVSDCSPKLLVYQDAFANIVEALGSQRPAQCVKLNGPDSLTQAFSTEGKIVAEIPFIGEFADPAMIIYTSGTTGAPKGAVISNQMLFWNSINTTLRLNINESDSTVIFLPFFHTGGWNVLTTPFFHRGAKITLLKKFEADRVLELCESEKATILFGVPTTMDLLSHASTFAKTNLKTLRYAIVGGEPMPLELIKTWHDRGVPIRQGYGLTEFGPNVFSLNEEHAISKIGSIGFPNFYIQAKVIDEKGQELGPNQIGELILKGPVCMTEYWENKAATAATIVNGWLHTGDLVQRDSDGFYFVVGRKKDMYKSGGENVYPAELEQVMRTAPGVREVAVIGVPDEKWGEVGHAFMVKKTPEASLEEVQAYCSKNLAKFKIPKYFTFLNELPKGDSGKILKRKLTELTASHA